MGKVFYTLKFKITIIYALLHAIFLVSCSRQPVYPAPPCQGSDVMINVELLKPESPNFFTYHYQRKNINFFVIKIDDKVLSFLDACEICYPRKLGYRFNNGYFTCRACNVRYSVSEVEKGFGSCFPIRLHGHLKDGKYIIPVSVLKEMADKF